MGKTDPAKLKHIRLIKTIGYTNLHTNLYKLIHLKPFKNNMLETSTYFYTPLDPLLGEREYNIYNIYIYIKIPFYPQDLKGYVEVCRSLLSPIKTIS